jgi:hypothetical protein
MQELVPAEKQGSDIERNGESENLKRRSRSLTKGSEEVGSDGGHSSVPSVTAVLQSARDYAAHLTTRCYGQVCLNT